MGMPIIFIHKGYTSYMEFTLRQAVEFNPGHDIILLGDESNDRFDFIRHYDLKDYEQTARAFAGIYRHHSTNSYEYELFCIQRWFILRDFMRDNEVSTCFVGDTDVLYYDDFEYVSKAAGDCYRCGMLIYPERHAASAGVSFWHLSELESFCDYCYKVYAEPGGFQRLIDQRGGNKFAGVSDMDLARGYIDSIGEDKVLNLADTINGKAIDVNFNMPHGCYNGEYRLDWRKMRKAVQWQGNTPYCFNTRLNRKVQFTALHFQGPAKYAIGAYFRGSRFSGKLPLQTVFFFLNIAASIYSKTLSPLRFYLKSKLLTQKK